LPGSGSGKMPTFSIQIVPILSIFVVRQEDDATHAQCNALLMKAVTATELSRSFFQGPATTSWVR